MKLPPLAHDAEELCAHLLRLDTTNPPGNERPAADYLAGKLREVGYDVTVIESAPTRANLVTRYRGDGRAAPILLAAPVCLQCHGSPEKDIAPATMAAIKKLYPEDKATGFQLGDLRGLWRVTFPAPVNPSTPTNSKP